MTNAKNVPNIILDEGGTNELTVYTEKVEKVYVKILTKLTPPTSTGNYGAGVKDTKNVDLLRIEIRFIVNGSIDSADESKIQNLFNAGGVFNFKYKGTTFTVNSDKLSIRNDNKFENDETPIIFTAIKGINL